MIASLMKCSVRYSSLYWRQIVYEMVFHIGVKEGLKLCEEGVCIHHKSKMKLGGKKDSNCVKKGGGIKHKSQRKLGEKKDFKLCEERLDVFIFNKSCLLVWRE